MQRPCSSLNVVDLVTPYRCLPLDNLADFGYCVADGDHNYPPTHRRNFSAVGSRGHQGRDELVALSLNKDRIHEQG